MGAHTVGMVWRPQLREKSLQSRPACVRIHTHHPIGPQPTSTYQRQDRSTLRTRCSSCLALMGTASRPTSRLTRQEPSPSIAPSPGSKLRLAASPPQVRGRLSLCRAEMGPMTWMGDRAPRASIYTATAQRRVAAPLYPATRARVQRCNATSDNGVQREATWFRNAAKAFSSSLRAKYVQP